MGPDDDPPLPPEEAPSRPRRGRWPVALAVALGLVVLAFVVAWSTRERIAGMVIAGQLESMGVPAKYRIESIGPRSQVLTNVVVGDPAHPDLTIERVETRLVARFGAPAIDTVTLVRPRLYGSWRGGTLSFGSLDKALFGGERKQPVGLPDMNLAVIDGRGLLESDYGPVGVKFDGKGPLRGGFAGTLAAIAPQFDAAGCRAERATIYGSIKVVGETPRFTGPLRLARLGCAQQRLALTDSGVEIDATLDPSLDGVDGKAALRTRVATYGENRAAAADGTLRFTWRKRMLTARYDIVATMSRRRRQRPRRWRPPACCAAAETGSRSKASPAAAASVSAGGSTPRWPRPSAPGRALSQRRWSDRSARRCCARGKAAALPVATSCAEPAAR
jgi:hypothetical protein